MNAPTVGIMMPVYNGYHTITKSIESLIAQTYTNWCCVIVNDGSTDLTLSLLKNITDKRFYIINLQQNSGRGAARKIALEKLKEFSVKYICMLDADDMYMPDKLHWQVKYMDENQQLSLISASVGIISNSAKLTGVVDFSVENDFFFFDSYIDYKPVSFASSIIRASDLNNISFDEKMKFAEDQDFLVRFLKLKAYTSIPKLSYLYYRDLSFSLKKYKQSLISELYTLRKLQVENGFLLKKIILAPIKISIVTLLHIIKLQHLYLSKIGREPNELEKIQFKNYLEGNRKQHK